MGPTYTRRRRGKYYIKRHKEEENARDVSNEKKRTSKRIYKVDLHESREGKKEKTGQA